jgi:methylthioribose-1-phosphate isomerase
LALAKQAGKHIHVFTPETRPYLQGARLTAPSVHEIGVPVQIIGDNMPAYVLSQGKIQKYFTAADLVTLDGHVVNKVGTFQNAITAHYHGVPFFVFSGGADKKKPDRASIEIEERDPAEMKQCRGVPTTDQTIDAYYPAFDITPPYLVSAVVTQYGILNPYDLKRYFGEKGLI